MGNKTYRSASLVNMKTRLLALLGAGRTCLRGMRRVGHHCAGGRHRRWREDHGGRGRSGARDVREERSVRAADRAARRRQGSPAVRAGLPLADSPAPRPATRRPRSAASRSPSPRSEDLDRSIKADFPSEKEFRRRARPAGRELATNCRTWFATSCRKRLARRRSPPSSSPTTMSSRATTTDNVDRYQQTKASHILMRETRPGYNDIVDRASRRQTRRDRRVVRGAGEEVSPNDPGSGEEGRRPRLLRSRRAGSRVSRRRPGKLDIGRGLRSGSVASSASTSFALTDRRLQALRGGARPDRTGAVAGPSRSEEASRGLVMQAYEDADVRVNSALRRTRSRDPANRRRHRRGCSRGRGARGAPPADEGGEGSRASPPTDQ